MIKVVFFARLKEQLGCDELEFPYSVPLSLMDLKSQLIEKNPSWQSAFDSQLMCAVNQDMTQDMSLLINDGDEVAWFPPVTGG